MTSPPQDETPQGDQARKEALTIQGELMDSVMDLILSWSDGELSNEDLNQRIKVVVSQDAAAEIAAKVNAIISSSKTPLHGHNETSMCDWCDTSWDKPDWRLDPQPAFFGHPRNDCLIWVAAAYAEQTRAEQ